MKKILIIACIFLINFSCNKKISQWENYNEEVEINISKTNKNPKLRYKRIQSISNDKNNFIRGFENQIRPARTCEQLGFQYFEDHGTGRGL